MFIAPSMFEYASTLYKWMRDYICQEHPQLGRRGPICPFVQSAIDKDALSLTFHYEVDGSSTAAIENLLRNYIKVFLCSQLPSECSSTLKAMLVVLPRILPEQTNVLDIVQARVKDDFVQNGLMLGQFHKNCPEPAVHNPQFPVSISPIPFFAIRYMAEHDILFLHQKKHWFTEYCARFAWSYEQGKAKSEFVELFQEAKKRFEF